MDKIIQVESIIENKIFTIRGQKVMIDRDLAELYGVETKRLNEAVKRNIKRFPDEFMFQLNDEEQNKLVAICDRLERLKHSSSNAYAFTEHGVTMLASVINSNIAISINIQIVKTFIALRQYAITQTTKSKEIDELKTMLMLHIENTDKRFNENDETIHKIISTLNHLIETPKKTNKIGFKTES